MQEHALVRYLLSQERDPEKRDALLWEVYARKEEDFLRVYEPEKYAELMALC